MAGIFILVGVLVAVASGYPSFQGLRDPTQGEQIGLAVGAGTATSAYVSGFVGPLAKHYEWPITLAAFAVGVVAIIAAVPTVLLVVSVLVDRFAVRASGPNSAVNECTRCSACPCS